MTLTVEYNIKFRFMKVTLGAVKGTTPGVELPITIPIAFEKVLMNDRGVYIKAKVA